MLNQSLKLNTKVFNSDIEKKATREGFVDPILADKIETTVARLDRTIKESYPTVKRVFVEAEAWRAKDTGMQAGSGI